PARDGAQPQGYRRRIAECDDHVVRIDLPQIRDDLRKHRLHALALRACARGHVDLSRSFDAHGRAFERTYPCAFVVAADAEAEISPLTARRALAGAKGINTAERLERLLQCERIVAAVEYHWLTIAIEEAVAIRHLPR